VRKKIEEHHEELLPLGLPEGVKPEQVLNRIHSWEGKLAEFISNWVGSMTFVYFHVAWFTAWIIINTTDLVSGYVGAFDPFPFGLLTMVVSLEAIFLSTFILINQNRQVLVDTYRELEDEEEEKEEEKEQEELEEDVQDIQKDLDDIKNAIVFIQQKISTLEKTPTSSEKTKSK
jgi:uncharacterized membrane protein